MKRYFEMINQNAVVEFTVEDGSPASTAPTEEFEKAYKTKLREVDKQEYLELKSQYEA